MKIENKTRDMLIIVDVSTLEEENLIATKFDYTLEAKKNKIEADNLYIVVTNKILNSHTKEDLKRIAREFKWPLGDRVKVFIKTNINDQIYQTDLLNSINQSFLRHAIEIRNMFSKKNKINLIHTSYFTDFNSYKIIDDDIKQEMIDSDIEFLAHSAENDIEGVICSTKSGYMSLDDCINLSMNENIYSDNESKENGASYSKHYNPKTIENYDDDNLPF